MLYDVGQSLLALFRSDCGISDEVEIVFDAPTKDWASRRSGPAVDVFLYDIRENLDRRQYLLEQVREGEFVTGMLPATRWFNCSYLVTAWTQRPDDEHRLLGGIISGLLTTHALPSECRRGALVTLEREVFLTVGRPLGSERSISDIWSALGGELKPSLDLVVVVPFEPQGTFAVGPPVLEAPSLFVGDGQVRRDAVGSVGDDPGRTKGHRRAKQTAGPRVSDDGLDGPSAPAAVEETVGGSEAQPGRRFRFSVHEPRKRE